MEGHPKDQCCGSFFHNFLPTWQLVKFVQVKHNILQKKYDNAFTLCDELMQIFEETNSIDSFLYGEILKNVIEALLNASESENAIKLVKQWIAKMKRETFRSFMILGIIYDRIGDYKISIEMYEQAHALANELNSQSLQVAASLAKMAMTNWTLSQPEIARECFVRCQQVLEQSSVETNVNQASAEELSLLVGYYNILGWLNSRIHKDHFAAKASYSKAVYIIQNFFSIGFGELEMMSQISICYAELRDKVAVEDYNNRALNMIENVVKNTEVVPAHVSEIIHIMSNLEFAYQRVQEFKVALQVKERILSLARNFQGDKNPVVAREAAQCIVMCWRQKRTHRINHLKEIFDKSLHESNYKNDSDKLKLYARELTDALCAFAEYNLLEKNYTAAEQYYEEAIDISLSVFGMTSLRTAKFMRFYGRMYKMWGKLVLGERQLCKSFEIVQRMSPNNLNLLNRLRSEITSCQNRYRKPHEKRCFD